MTASRSPASSDLNWKLRLKELSATLPDARVIGRVLHPLPDVLLVALCSMLSDGEGFTHMEFFARSQLAWLRQFYPAQARPALT